MNLSQQWCEGKNKSEETSYIRCKPAKKVDFVSRKMRGFSWKNVFFFRTKLCWNCDRQEEFLYDALETSDSTKNRPETLSNSIKMLMHWGCIRSNGEKIIVPIKNKVDASCYIQFLKNHALNF